MFKKSILVLGVALIFSGCAYQSGWSPAMDPYGDPNVANISRDQIDCRVLAKRAVGNPGVEVGKSAILGGATGAALGALAGSPALGAAVGGVGGLVKQGFGVDNQYKQAFINCLRGRGHSVL